MTRSTNCQGSSDSSKAPCGTDQKSVHDLLRSQRKQEKKVWPEIRWTNKRTMAKPNPFKNWNMNSTMIDCANADMKQTTEKLWKQSKREQRRIEERQRRKKSKGLVEILKDKHFRPLGRISYAQMTYKKPLLNAISFLSFEYR